MFGASSGTVFIEETRSLSGFGSFAQSPEGYETEEERTSRRTKGMLLIGLGAIGALGGLVIGAKKSKLAGGALAVAGLAAAGVGTTLYRANKALLNTIATSTIPEGRTEVPDAATTTPPTKSGLSVQNVLKNSGLSVTNLESMARNVR